MKIVLLITALVLMAMAAAGWFFSRYARVVQMTVTVPPSTSPIDYNRVFEDSRRKLTDGKFPDARAAFARLAADTKGDSRFTIGRS